MIPASHAYKFNEGDDISVISLVSFPVFLQLFCESTQVVLTLFVDYANLQLSLYLCFDYDRGASHHQYFLPQRFRRAMVKKKGIVAEGELRRKALLGGQRKCCPTVASAEGYHDSANHSLWGFRFHGVC